MLNTAKKRSNKQGGFTLIELLVASAIGAGVLFMGGQIMRIMYSINTIPDTTIRASLDNMTGIFIDDALRASDTFYFDGQLTDGTGAIYIDTSLPSNTPYSQMTNSEFLTELGLVDPTVGTSTDLTKRAMTIVFCNPDGNSIWHFLSALQSGGEGMEHKIMRYSNRGGQIPAFTTISEEATLTSPDYLPVFSEGDEVITVAFPNPTETLSQPIQMSFAIPVK
jgi:prepilin-type N-terminal cleavage/methylation domain-containing protein